MRIIYIADDGTQFDDEFDCEAYEFRQNLPVDCLKFYDEQGNEMPHELFEDETYNFSQKIVVPDKASLECLHKVADYCGWCEWDRIDSIGTWVWKNTTPDSYCCNEHFVKED